MSTQMELYKLICQEIIDKNLNRFEAKDKLANILNDYKIVRDEENPIKYDLKLNIEKFLNEKEKEGFSELSLSSYRQQLSQFSDYTSKQVNRITKDDIKDYLFYKDDSNKSKSTLKLVRSVLKGFFGWLIAENMRYDNPVISTRPYKIPQTFIEALSKEELQLIRSNCNTARERALVEFLYSTGCMISEVSNLALDSIDINVGEVYIKGKGTRTRTVYLTKSAKDSLNSYINLRNDECKEVFITYRKPFRKLGNRVIEKDLTNIVRRAGINKRISPKTFRHTFAKVMLDKGCPMHILQALLGHKVLMTTSKTYGKVSHPHQKQAFNDYSPD